MTLFRYAFLYHLYKLKLSEIIRVIFFLLVVAFSLFSFAQGLFPKFPLTALSLFLMLEVVYHFKVMRVRPKISIQKNTIDKVYESCTLQTLDTFYFTSSTSEVIKNLLIKKNVQFIMRKANITLSDVHSIEIPKRDLAGKAFTIVKELEGSFVTSMDIFVAYLLITEPQTQLLFNKHLKEEDIYYILYWARFDNPEEENPPASRVHFWGEGLLESITTGWTLETQKYTTDITYKVLDEKPRLLGRKQEFHTIIESLSRTAKNNVLLIGETGVGKTSLVDALALNSFLGLLDGRLYHKRVYQLQVGPLVAGTRDVGSLEERIEAILLELSHAGNVILFIPDLENIIGASTFHIDLSGALIPFLKNIHLPIIATATPGAFKTFIEPNTTFTDLFELIRIEEPDRDEAIQMLLEKANEVEDKFHVSITYKAVIAVVDFAKRFMQDRVLPGSAMSLLTSVVSSVSASGKNVIDSDDVTTTVEQKTHVAIATPGVQEKDLLLHLEDKLHARIIDQEEAVNAIAQAIRRVRAGLATQTRPISFLFLGPTGVGKTETAKALASVYFGGEDKTIRLDMSEYTSPGSVNRLLGATAGSGNEKGELTEKVSEHPFSLLMLDEFEKAHPEVLDLFLQVLEDGRLTDNHGKRVSFANTIIIATSNGAALYIQDQLSKGVVMDSNFQQGLIHELETEHAFKPELLNRFDGIIVFKPLVREAIEQIAKLFLQDVAKKLLVQDIHISFDDSVMKFAAQEGFDPQFGARPLRRYIQDKIEDPIARGILDDKIQRGQTLVASIDQTGRIIISPQLG